MKLVKPSWKYRAEVSDFIYEMKNDVCPFNAEFPAYMGGGFRALMDKISSGTERETYWISTAGGILGAVLLRRISDTDKAVEAGGNIGFVVRPSARRKGVAFYAVSAALPMLAGDMDTAVIGAYESNIASVRTIEKAVKAFGGGLIKKIWTEDEDNPLTKSGVWDIYYAVNCNQKQ